MKRIFYLGSKKYIPHINAKKYALYIGKKIVEKTLEFLTLPARFVSKKVQDLKNLTLYGNSKQGILPDGYTQLECTKNTGDVFIDTGILPTDNTILKIRYRPTTKLGSNYIFGSRSGSNTTIYGIGGASSGSKISTTYSRSSVESDITRGLNIIYDIEASFINGVNTLTVTDETNNVTDTKSVTYDWSPQDTTFKFYGFNSSNCINVGVEVFEVEIIQDGVSVYHAYPCQQGEAVGFYDIVGNTFTSDVNLTAGDILPTPTAPLEIESVGDKQVLPYGYTQLEYLQSDSTAYIDTGIAGEKDTLEIYCKFSYSTYVAYGAVYGNYISDDSNGFRCILGSTKNRVYVCNNTICSTTGNTELSLSINDTHTLISNNAEITLDGITTQITKTGKGDVNTGNIALLNRSITNPNTTRNIGLKVYEFYIKDNGVLVRNLVPAKRNSNGVVGMYDTVSNTFLHSAGTGEFIAGAKVEQGGYKVPVTVSGKNLFDKNSLTWTRGYLSGDGSITGGASSSLQFNNVTIPVKPNTTYTLSNPDFVQSGTKNITLTTQGNVEYKPDIFISRIWSGSDMSVATFTTNPETNGVVLTVSHKQKLDNIQLEEGDTATSYQQYVEPTTTNIYLNEPLRKIGEYADTLSVDGTDVTVVRNVEEIDNTGTKPIEESLIHKVPSTTETYSLSNTINSIEGTTIIDVDAKIKPSKMAITGDIDNE